MAYNGTPTFRIWITGTNHLLGVHEIWATDDAEVPLMPPALWRMTGGFESEIFADFEVCPLSKPRNGAMQFICVEAANHLTKKPYRNP